VRIVRNEARSLVRLGSVRGGWGEASEFPGFFVWRVGDLVR
jgi:hypothetical protein